MSEATKLAMGLLVETVKYVNIGTNLGLLYMLWALISGQFLPSRGAVFPALSRIGLNEKAVRRGWRALAKGGWKIGELLVNWEKCVMGRGYYTVRSHGGYVAVPADLTAFYRPRLKNCPSKHYDHKAGKALPAIVLGVMGRVGQVGDRRFLLPLSIDRMPSEESNENDLMKNQVKTHVKIREQNDALLTDGGYPLKYSLEEKIPFVSKVAVNFKARRLHPPEYSGRGPRTGRRGEVVRPLPRKYKDRTIDGTPPDRQCCRKDHEGNIIEFDVWDNLVESDMDRNPDAQPFSVVVVRHPKYKDPLCLAYYLPPLDSSLNPSSPSEPTPSVHTAPAKIALPVFSDETPEYQPYPDFNPIDPAHVYALYQDRWPVEHPPLAAKTLLGTERSFVHDPECCQRLPELALLAASIITFAAAILPPIPTGFWDRFPQSTPGRLRRHFEGQPFPQHFPLPLEITEKSAHTSHLPTGFNPWLQAKYYGHPPPP